MITLRDVSRTYAGPPPVTALSEVDFTVGEGELATIVGPSGSGKSTLMNLLGLLDRPDSGEYWLGGVDTGALSEAERSALRGTGIGFVFQSFHLMPHRSAAENVALGLLYTGRPARERSRSAAEALERVDLSHRMQAPPSQLSGGERQRVAIARALVHRPGLLLCDEPTGNLDSATAATVLDLITGLHADGHTVVIITHDSAVAARGQRRFSIWDGRTSETG